MTASIQASLRGYKLLFHPQVRMFVIVPMLINTVVLVLLFGWLFGTVDGWVATAVAWLPGWLEWLGTILNVLLWVAAVIVFCITFTITANFIAAPFNGFLSARVEKVLTGYSPETGLTLWQETLEGLTGELHKLWFAGKYAMGLGVLSLILLFVPGINILSPLVPFAWLYFSIYMLAFEYIDFPAANHGLDFAAKKDIISSNRPLTLSFGAIVTFMTSIPVINLIVMPAAVCGSTVLWVERIHQGTGK